MAAASRFREAALRREAFLGEKENWFLTRENAGKLRQKSGSATQRRAARLSIPRHEHSPLGNFPATSPHGVYHLPLTHPRVRAKLGCCALGFTPRATTGIASSRSDHRQTGHLTSDRKKTRQAPAAHEFGLEPAVPSHEGTWGRSPEWTGGRRVVYGVGTARKNRRCAPEELVST